MRTRGWALVVTLSLVDGESRMAFQRWLGGSTISQQGAVELESLVIFRHLVEEGKDVIK